jgi:hypothetical protein
MTLETNLQSIADSLAIIAQHLVNSKAPVAPVVAVAAPVAPPAPVAAAVVAPAAPVAAPVVISTVMPALPTFDLPVPVAPAAATVPSSPFANKQAMTDFVLASYKALGAEKGAKIQDVLVALGCKNINDVPEAQWGALKTGVEALK